DLIEPGRGCHAESAVGKHLVGGRETPWLPVGVQVRLALEELDVQVRATHAARVVPCPGGLDDDFPAEHLAIELARDFEVTNRDIEMVQTQKTEITLRGGPRLGIRHGDLQRSCLAQYTPAKQARRNRDG